jgi:hypothetical protein
MSSGTIESERGALPARDAVDTAMHLIATVIEREMDWLAVQRLKAWGLLEERGTRLKLTQAGRDTLRRLMGEVDGPGPVLRGELRGGGYGYRLWQAGMERLAGCTVDLDGVIAQQRIVDVLWTPGGSDREAGGAFCYQSQCM